MKNLSFCVFLLFLTFPLFAQFEGIPYNFEYCYRATVSKIDVKEKPALSSELLFRLEKNDEIFVDKNKKIEGWFYCYIPKHNTSGYCLSDYFVSKPYFEDIVELLVQKRPDIIFMVNSGEVLPCQSVTSVIQFQLQKAKKENALFVVQKAVESGGSLVHKNDVSNPLVESVKLDNLDLVEYLLDNGARKFINERSRQFAPPLYWAIKNGNLNMVAVLLKYGADPAGISYNGISYKDHIQTFLKKGILDEEKASYILNLITNPE